MNGCIRLEGYMLWCLPDKDLQSHCQSPQGDFLTLGQEILPAPSVCPLVSSVITG